MTVMLPPPKLFIAGAWRDAADGRTLEVINSSDGEAFTKIAGPALNDLVGGQVDFMTDQIVNVVEQVKAGSIEAYAIATPERSPALPDLPTTKEAGMPDGQASAWNAIFAPKGTPKEFVAEEVARWTPIIKAAGVVAN